MGDHYFDFLAYLWAIEMTKNTVNATIHECNVIGNHINAVVRISLFSFYSFSSFYKQYKK